MDSLEDREFPGTDGATYPFWSPDSTRIGFFSQSKLRQVSVGGGPTTALADAPDARGGAWGQKGTIVFAPSVVGTLYRVSVSSDGSGAGTATPMDLPRAGSGSRDSLRFPAFILDSDRFFYTIEADKREGEGIYVGSLNGDAPVRILPDFSTTRFVPSAGSKTNGFILFRRGTTLMAQRFNATNLATAGPAFPLADQVPDSGNTSNTAFTVSANGTLIYLSGDMAPQEREVVWLSRSGKRGKSLLKQKGITGFALSPDERKLVYSLGSQRVQGDLWMHDVTAGVSQRFTFGPFSAFAPIWAPNGASVVFTAFPEDRLYKKPTQTSGAEAPLSVSGTNTFASSFSMDGKVLAYSQTGAASKSDVWLLLEGEEKPKPFQTTALSEAGGEISSDGRWMAYMKNSSLKTEVYVAPIVPGRAERQISVEGGVTPKWRRDGAELYFISDFKLMAIDVTGSEPTFGAPRELFREPALFATEGTVVAYSPNADGSQFLVLISVGAAPSPRPLNVITNWESVYVK
jgi:Tol biopolymer transport system component